MQIKTTRSRRHYVDTQIQIDAVFPVKHHRSVLSDGDIRKLVDKTFREEAKRLGVSILSLEIKPDHVQVRAELPPHLAPLKFITRLKAESSHAVYEKFPNLKEGIALKVR